MPPPQKTYYEKPFTKNVDTERLFFHGNINQILNISVQYPSLLRLCPSIFPLHLLCSNTVWMETNSYPTLFILFGVHPVSTLGMHLRIWSTIFSLVTRTVGFTKH